MASSCGASSITKKDNSVAATIAIFQYDLQTPSLKQPLILQLSKNYTQLTSDSGGLWENTLMRYNPVQLPPLVSLAFQTIGNGEHRLLFPVGGEHLKVVINNSTCLPDCSNNQGHVLKDGDLVRVYCTNWHISGQDIAFKEWIGRKCKTFSFQYHAGTPMDMATPSIDEGRSEKKLVSDLPSELLRSIFAYLPVDQVLHDIPAVCNSFFEAIQDSVQFHSWQIAGNGITLAEQEFSLSWTHDQPVKSLVMQRVSMVTKADFQSATDLLLDLGDAMKLESVQLGIITPQPGEENWWYSRSHSRAVREIFWALAKLPHLKRLKLTGLPVWPKLYARYDALRALEWLSLDITGNQLPEEIHPGDLARITPKLETLVLTLAVPNNGAQLMPGVEEYFAAFASPSRQPFLRRVLKLSMAARDHVACRTLLTSLATLDSLLLEIDGPLESVHLEAIVNALPVTLRVLWLVTDSFDDELCRCVTKRCCSLEVFACNSGTTMSKNGVDSLVNGGDKLVHLFLIKKIDNCASADFLPERLLIGLKSFEKVLWRLFY